MEKVDPEDHGMRELVSMALIASSHPPLGSVSAFVRFMHGDSKGISSAALD